MRQAGAHGLGASGRYIPQSAIACNSQDPELALSRTEWQAVTVALRDAERCGCGSRLDVADATRPDPRLDALRRFVCAARRQGAGRWTLCRSCSASASRPPRPRRRVAA